MMIIIQNLKQSLFPQNMYLFFVLFLLCLCVLYNVSLLLPYSSSSLCCSTKFAIFTRLITQFIPESRKHRVFIVLLLLLPPLLLSSLLLFWCLLCIYFAISRGVYIRTRQFKARGDFHETDEYTPSSPCCFILVFVLF